MKNGSSLAHAILRLLLVLVAAAPCASAQIVTTTDVDSGSGGDTGRQCSQAVVSGTPAVAYYNTTDNRLMFARNSAADGSGTWTLSPVTAGGVGGNDPFLTVISGLPAISFADANFNVVYARNSAADGSGTWTFTTVSANTNSQGTWLGVVNARPVLLYAFRDDLGAVTVKYARNSAADGSGTWSVTTVDSSGSDSARPSLGIVGGKPAVAFGSYGTLKYARNSAIDGSGTWTVTNVDTTGDSTTASSMLALGTGPLLAYYAGTPKALKAARNSAAARSIR